MNARPTIWLDKHMGSEPSGQWVNVNIEIKNIDLLAKFVGWTEQEVRDDAWENSPLHPKHWGGIAYRDSAFHYHVWFKDKADLDGWYILT